MTFLQEKVSKVKKTFLIEGHDPVRGWYDFLAESILIGSYEHNINNKHLVEKKWNNFKINSIIFLLLSQGCRYFLLIFVDEKSTLDTLRFSGARKGLDYRWLYSVFPIGRYQGLLATAGEKESLGVLEKLDMY